jgi:hypothetical protein
MGKNTEYNRHQTVQNLTLDLIARCKAFHWSSKRLNSEWNNLRGGELFPKMTGYYRWHITGFYEAARKFGIDPLIAWGHWIDGVFVEKGTTEQTMRIIKEGIPCVAVWRDDPTKPWWPTDEETKQMIADTLYGDKKL